MKRKILILTTILSFIFYTSESSAFGPCQKFVPGDASYLPELSQCGGKAAIVLMGRFRKAYSVVVRDCNNNDRDPCYSSSESCGTASSSPFKVQKTIRATLNREGDLVRGTIHCLKERGDSKIFQIVRRMTIKMQDPVRGPQDIVKICLSTRTQAINEVEVFSTSVVKGASGVGYNGYCPTQRYLACDYSYANICPKYD